MYMYRRYQCDAICICIGATSVTYSYMYMYMYSVCTALYVYVLCVHRAKMYMYRRYQCDPGAVDTEFYSCGDSAACAGPDAWLHDCPPCPAKVCVGCV